jgi:hypothetical protein
MRFEGGGFLVLVIRIPVLVMGTLKVAPRRKGR